MNALQYKKYLVITIFLIAPLFTQPLASAGGNESCKTYEFKNGKTLHVTGKLCQKRSKRYLTYYGTVQWMNMTRYNTIIRYRALCVTRTKEAGGRLTVEAKRGWQSRASLGNCGSSWSGLRLIEMRHKK